MKSKIPRPANPAITYNPVENRPIFQRVLGVSGVSGLAEKLPDPWTAKLPRRCGLPAPAPKSLPSATIRPSLSSDEPPLVPLDAPWIDGQRYREAGASEVSTRLDCYLADPAGPWIRRHDVLILFEAPA